MYTHVNSTLYIEPRANLTHKLQCIIAAIRKNLVLLNPRPRRTRTGATAG